MFMLVTDLAGCSGEGNAGSTAERPTREQVLAECGGPGDATWPLSSEGLGIVITDACSDALAAAFRIDWATFDERAADVGSVAWSFANGAVIVVASDEDHAPVLEPPSLLTENWSGGAGAWYEFMGNAITRVEYAPEKVEGTYGMSYSDGTISVGDLSHLDDQEFICASGLVHESVHALPSTSHETCETGLFAGLKACDPTSEGAYGVEAWWMAEWLVIRGLDLEESSCRSLLVQQTMACWHLDDVTGFAACDEEPTWCAREG